MQHLGACPRATTATAAASRSQRPARTTTASTTLAPTAAFDSSHGAACPHLSAHGGTYPAPTSSARVSRPRLRRQTARHRAEQLVRCSPRRRSASATLRTGTFGRCESDTVLCSAQSSNISFWCLASSTTQSRRRDTLVTRTFVCTHYLHGFSTPTCTAAQQQQQLANAAQLARSPRSQQQPARPCKLRGCDWPCQPNGHCPAVSRRAQPARHVSGKPKP